MKKRILYMDIIRVLSMTLVILYHVYTSFYDFTTACPGFPFRGVDFRGVSVGGLGVTMFFMLSGSALMLHRESQPLKVYYRKRFLAIYPSFWLAWLGAWMISVLILGRGHILAEKELWTLPVSLLGMDGYLSDYIPLTISYYMVGEWFLGCIVLVYLFFPLVRLGIEKRPVLTGLLLTAYWLYGQGFRYPPMHGIDVSLRIFEVALGAYLMRYVKKVPWWTLPVCVCAFLSQIYWPIQLGPFGLISQVIMGAALFVFLRGCIEPLAIWIPDRQTIPMKVLGYLSSISFETFLVHKFLLLILIKVLIRDESISIEAAWGFLAVYFIATVIGAVCLKTLKDRILLLFARCGKRKERLNTAKL